jgi:hypothetical protein
MAHLSNSSRPGHVGRALLRVVFDHSTKARKPTIPLIRPAQAVRAWHQPRLESEPAWQRSLPA